MRQPLPADILSALDRMRLLHGPTPSGEPLFGGVSSDIWRIDLPEENKESVFARMRAERERIARQTRAEGAEEAVRIRAGADRRKTEILAQAYEEAEKVRGEGDGRSMRIYADAYNHDPDFYRLTRTLDAYKKFLNDKTTIVLSSDSDLMRLLTTGKLEGKR